MAAAAVIGIMAFGVASVALWRQPETYGRDLDFVEDGRYSQRSTSDGSIEHARHAGIHAATQAIATSTAALTT